MISDRQTLQELPAKPCGLLNEMFGRKSTGIASGKILANFDQVDGGPFGIKEHVFAIGNDSFVAGLVDK